MTKGSSKARKHETKVRKISEAFSAIQDDNVSFADAISALRFLRFELKKDVLPQALKSIIDSTDNFKSVVDNAYSKFFKHALAICYGSKKAINKEELLLAKEVVLQDIEHACKSINGLNNGAIVSAESIVNDIDELWKMNWDMEDIESSNSFVVCTRVEKAEEEWQLIGVNSPEND